MISAQGTDIVPIRVEGDIVTARQRGRTLAGELGFSSTECTLIATAISEVARNIIEYAGTGEIALARVFDSEARGIVIVARDRGPGIPDVTLAMRDGYSTGGSLGMGLPGAKRLMDELDIETGPDAGTVITLRKWVP